MKTIKLKLRKSERSKLERLMRTQSGWAAVARRARIILMSVDGVAFNEIYTRLDYDVRYIQRWRERFVADRIGGLDSRERGRPAKKVDAKLEAKVLRYAVARKPDYSPLA